ncbi:MAG: MBL fold metallo-hydrolase [Bacteroidota bacterium]
MHPLADDLYAIPLMPRYGVNAYLLGDVLVDAGIRQSRRRLERALAGHRVTAHALTHVHPDHQGASHALCSAYGWPLWCGAADASAMETGVTPIPPSLLTHLLDRVWTGPAHPVARTLAEGDEVGGFDVIETPGHTSGHLAFWRARDRALVLGDVLNGMHLVTTWAGLCEPPAALTADPVQNRASARKLADLHPRLVCFGHGPPMRNDGQFEDFVNALA